MEGLPDNLHLQKEELVQYLSLLVEEQVCVCVCVYICMCVFVCVYITIYLYSLQFLLKTDDAGGGSYCVSIQTRYTKYDPNMHYPLSC